MTFTLPAGQERYWLVNASLPACLVNGTVLPTLRPDGLARGNILVENGKIARIAFDEPPADDAAHLELGQRMVLPRFVEVHTHLDKGHIFPRAANPDGTFMGALSTVMADRSANWNAGDVRARMEFALKCALHHGTGAIRTHLDSRIGQSAISWAVFNEVRAEWKDRIALQAAAIFPTIFAIENRAEFDDTLRHVTRYGGVLGGVTYIGEKTGEALDHALDITLQTASAHGLDLDLHVDESAAEEARTLEQIADAVLRNRFTGKVLAGHCCSLALMADADRARVTEKLGEAGIAIVSLPMCNLYLQDRQSGRTPRWRGVAPLHELDAAGISTMVSSDNTRDPFYAYGDLDAVEVYREATRILHFDHSARPWLEAITARPADQMRLAGAGRIIAGGPADLIIFAARTMNEYLSRPQHDRLVVIRGEESRAPLPDYAEMDGIF